MNSNAATTEAVEYLKKALDEAHGNLIAAKGELHTLQV
jgi:hypothetical protein